MKKQIVIFLLVSLSISCEAQVSTKNLFKSERNTSFQGDSLKITNYYSQNKGTDLLSKMQGTVSNGALIHGKLMPFYGENFTYFDSESYLAGRAFTSDVVRNIILKSYSELDSLEPNRQFYLMELSNQCGGKIHPHRTHQNGLSVDFMMPKVKNGNPDYSLDTLGKEHYFLDFDENGKYIKDKSIQIDFNLIAKHLIILEKNANLLGYKIGKVIIKIEYKDDLFATQYGQILKKSSIYFVQGLSPIINQLHDDHYHVDFEKL